MNAKDARDLRDTVAWLDSTDRLDDIAWPMSAAAPTEIDLEIRLAVSASLGLRRQNYLRYSYNLNR